MKNYKVGDTIYVKGKIVEIDHDDTDLPYCVNVGPINGIWPDRSDIIDELPPAEPVKPVLPKGVADELENYKSLYSTFHRYLHDSWSDKFAAPNSYLYLKNSHDEKILATAWYNGYTVEKEPTWYIKVPGKFVRPTYYAINDGSLAFGYLDEDKKGYRDYSAHAFTNEEIKKYDLENFKKELVTDDSED